MSGLFICVSWYKMTKRGFLWTRFWIEKANRIEKQLKGKVNPIIEGKKLRDIVGSSGTTEKASCSVIFIFAAIYLLLFIFNFY